jgi:hypothetical protein
MKLKITLLLILISVPLIAAKAQTDEASRPETILSQRAGTWDAVIEIQLKAETAPITSQGVEYDKMSADGKWLISDFEGQLFGSKFTGHAVTGFDAKKGKYVGVWIDPSSGINLVDGEYDTRNRIFTTVSYKADKTDDAQMKQVTDESTPDVRVVTFPSPEIAGRKIYKMKITYKRRK